MTLSKLDNLQANYIKKAESVSFLNKVNTVKKLHEKIKTIIEDFIKPIKNIDPNCIEVTYKGDVTVYKLYDKEFEIHLGLNSIDIRKVKLDGVYRKLLVRYEDNIPLKSNGVNYKSTTLKESDLYSAIHEVLS